MPGTPARKCRMRLALVCLLLVVSDAEAAPCEGTQCLADAVAACTNRQDAEACHDASEMYWKGSPRDDAKRFHYLVRACELGHGWSCFDMGQLARGGAPG